MSVAPESLTSQSPLVSILLIAYNQEDVVVDAVHAALAQDYSPLEILISDDHSQDQTFDVIQRALEGYSGPHRIIVNRNDRNEGISAHLSKLVQASNGELLVIAAGDDVSFPERCSRVVAAWLAHDRKPDLIATDLVELNADGDTLARISPTDLTAYRNFDDWLARRPYLIGAAHAWSRRLFERFGGMMPGASAEDQIMTFRAIVSGGALSLREPLVKYRHGGISRKRVWRSVDEFIAHMRQSNRFSLAEIAQLLHDAEIAGLGERMRNALASKLAREQYTHDLFVAQTFLARLKLAAYAHQVKLGLRIRMLLYAAFPWVYVPFFYIKRRLANRHSM